MSLDKLNGVLEDIAGEIGYTATTSLVDWFGGRSLYVPGVFDAEHPICKVIGEPAFKRLVAVYGDTTISLPLDYRREISRRNRMIGALYVMGKGTTEIAKVAMMTPRQVANVRAELEAAGLLPLILRAGAAQIVSEEVRNGRTS